MFTTTPDILNLGKTFKYMQCEIKIDRDANKAGLKM